MSINFKIFLSALSISVLSTNSMSRAFDIYDNPHLTDSSLTTTFVARLRNTNINDMEKLIEGECNQYKNYVYLSVENWDLAKFKHKSLAEAEEYSRQLTRQIPYQQSSQYTFPFGIRTYIESEEILKNAVYNRTEPLKQKELIDDMYYTCIQMNKQKYFMLLDSNTYGQNNQSIFLSENELVQKFDSTHSLLKLKHIPSEKDKLTPPNVGKKIGFTEKELLAANTLIDDDIKNSFSQGQKDVRWIDYKKVSRNMQSNFEKFLKEGGKNINFTLIASVVKYRSLETENFKNLEIRNAKTFKSLFDKNSKEVSEEKLKSILKNFNY